MLRPEVPQAGRPALPGRRSQRCAMQRQGAGEGARQAGKAFRLARGCCRRRLAPDTQKSSIHDWGWGGEKREMMGMGEEDKERRLRIT